MSSPAGWYPDPQSTAPGAPRQQRYWDGATWTSHVAPLDAPAAYPYGAGVPGRATTPDGAPLAGWWHRLGASLIDSVIVAIVGFLVAFPFWGDLFDAFGDFLDESVRAAENGTSAPSQFDFQSEIAGTVVIVSLINLALSFVYHVAFLAWRQATPGKLMTGLKVRLRERDALPIGSVLARWGVQFGITGVLAVVPIVSYLGSMFSILDHLWPLWDEKKQALHDKAARTNVVRTRG